MTIHWHLTTGPTVDVLQLSGYLGDDAVSRFNGAVGWALARGERTLLLDCTQLRGWSAAGRLAVVGAAEDLGKQSRALELVAAPQPVEGVPGHEALDAALAQHKAAADGGEGGDAWHSDRWDADRAS